MLCTINFRDGNICPLFKKGKKEAPGNYRPVSLTSVVGKVLESIIKDELTSHLEANNILIPQQHGFRSGKSCTTNLLEYLNQVTEMIDNREPVDIMFFYYQKAFDLVPHKNNNEETGKLWSEWSTSRVDQKLVKRSKAKSCDQWVLLWLGNCPQRRTTSVCAWANLIFDFHKRSELWRDESIEHFC